MFSFFHNKYKKFRSGAVSVLASVFLVTIGSQVFAMHKRDGKTPIRLKTENAEHALRVRLAVTPEEKERGLMWVKRLSKNGGMLFVYEEPQTLAFWMKNMSMPIDILFIGADKKVKYIAHEAYPCLEKMVCPRFAPEEPIQYVLEVSPGYAKKHQIGLGDELIF